MAYTGEKGRQQKQTFANIFRCVRERQAQDMGQLCTQRERGGEGERERDRKGWRQTDRQREEGRERHSERDRDRDRNRDRETERDKERQRQTERKYFSLRVFLIKL